MLDPKFIKQNIKLVKETARKKGAQVDIDRFLELNEMRNKIKSDLDEYRKEKNLISEKIIRAKDEEKKVILSEATKVKEKIKLLEENSKLIEEEWHTILMQIPNITCPEMPEGESEDDNVTIRTWGKLPKFDFDPQTHDVLGKRLDLIDTEKATKVSGSRFYYLKRELVLMQFALTMFVFETLTNEKIIKKIIKERNLNISSKPFVPLLPPVMIKNEVQASIHRVFGEQTYKLKDTDLNLVASAEHSMAPYHIDEIVDEKELPLRYIGYSTSFRKEAGTYGKDMAGIFRCHQFDKSEMVSFTTAETGEYEQEMIVGIQEYLVQQFKLPYRVQQICTGDTGKPNYQQFDIETWFPGQNLYRETHTSDYMTDYQTRGINACYKTKNGKRKLLHTNDATAFATRFLIAIMENYQTKDGDIIIPNILVKFMGGKTKITI
jgi:seryl-tRNA synthetase